MICVECGKTLSVSRDNEVEIQTGCYRTSPSYFCSCGRLHWPDGNGVFNRRNQKAYFNLETNTLENKD